MWQIKWNPHKGIYLTIKTRTNVIPAALNHPSLYINQAQTENVSGNGNYFMASHFVSIFSRTGSSTETIKKQQL
jgi:hypothetical protein